MLMSIPHAANSDTIDEPPKLKNGTGTPVKGINATVESTFNNICPVTHVTMPTAIYAPKCESAR